MISISKAEHLPSFWNRGPEELGNGLITAAVDFGEKMRYFLLRHNFSEITTQLVAIVAVKIFDFNE